jgi:hypothetical protein
MMAAGDLHRLTSLVETDLVSPEVGSLSVDPDSGLLRVDAPGVIRFGFSFAGHAFEADAVPADGKMLIEAVTMIGRLPYSIEDRARRGSLLRVLGRAGESGFQLRLGHDQVIRLRIETELLPPATSTRMIGAIVALLIPGRPYLDLLAEFVRPASPQLPALRA